jgi:hypothetical protein
VWWGGKLFYSCSFDISSLAKELYWLNSVHLNEFNIKPLHVPGAAYVVGAVGVEILDFHYWISIGREESFTMICWMATFEECHWSSFLGVGGGGGSFCGVDPLSVMHHQGSIFAFGLPKNKENKFGGGRGRGGGSWAMCGGGHVSRVNGQVVKPAKFSPYYSENSSCKPPKVLFQ